jgi:hypothetical protein
MVDRIQRLAKREGRSLNQTALRLRCKKPGRKATSEGAGTVGSSLDHLIGTWTQAEADELDSALEAFEKVDAPGRKYL